MNPDGHTVQVLGFKPGGLDNDPETILRGAALDIYQAPGGRLVVRISSHDGHTDIELDAAELLLAIRIMADDTPEATARVLADINKERARQRALWLDEKIPFCCDVEDISLGDKMAVLTEEVGEVAKEVNEANASLHPSEPMRRLRTELIQVAAVATAWAESLNDV